MNNNSSLLSLHSIDCPHFSACSGCIKNEPLSPPSSLYIQAHDYVKKRSNGTLQLTLERGSFHGWRTRAKLAAATSSSGIQFGLYQHQSHHLVQIPDCRVHHPSINRAVQQLQRKINSRFDEKLVYDEKSHTGLLRYIQLTVERSTGKVQLGVVVNASLHSIETRLMALKKCLEELCCDAPNLWHSIWLNFNPEKTNVIAGLEWLQLAGRPAVWENLCSFDIPFLPFHFEQANLEMFQQAVLDIKEHDIEKGSTLIELYAGMGVIGLCLSDKASRVISVEASRRAYETHCLALQKLPAIEQAKMSFIQGDSEEEYRKLLGSRHQDLTQHTLIVDPPRKGLSQGLLQMLTDLPDSCASPQKLIYISCHFPSLKRDSDVLIDKGGWTISRARSYLFFPGTDHIETVFSFSKK